MSVKLGEGIEGRACVCVRVHVYTRSPRTIGVSWEQAKFLTMQLAHVRNEMGAPLL